MVNNVLCVFDLDGTVIDSKDAILGSALRTLNSFGIQNANPRDILESIGLPISVAFKKYLTGLDIERATLQFRSDLATTGSSSTRVFQATCSTLEKLESMGVILAIASNKPSYLAREVLIQQRLDKYFRNIEGADTSLAKPSPEMLIKLKEQHPNMDLYVMVGDRGEDMEAAKGAGYIGYFIDHGTISPDSLDSSMYARRLTSLNEIAFAIETDWINSGSR